MTKAAIDVALRGGRPEGPLRRFAPGETLSGMVQILPSEAVNCRHVYVRLGWHTEGRGDRDEGCVAQIDVFQGTMTAGLPVSHEFSFVLPSEPWSYAGHYITIVWDISVELDVPWAFNPKHSQPFILAPHQVL